MIDFDPKKDYYSILGISETATEEEIKKAFKQLALKYHPDRAPQDKKKEYEEKFKEINEAYQILSDPNKRRQYDYYRKGGFGFGGFSSGFDGDIFGDIFDIFSDFFGTKSRSRYDYDIVLNINITFEESYKGTKKKVKYQRYIDCNYCNGTGIDPHSEKIKCQKCGGKGYIHETYSTPFGFFSKQHLCNVCNGKGYIDTKKCEKCNGKGFLIQENEIFIEIPAGIHNGDIIKIKGEGHNKKGDLLIKINVNESIRKRQNDDILLNWNIDVYDAVLGGEIIVPHPSGDIKVKIPKGLQANEKIIVKGKGFKKDGFLKYGDFIIIPNIVLPKKLSKEEENLWQKLRDLQKK